jgi:gentisate 1,2-dioxygenase
MIRHKAKQQSGSPPHEHSIYHAVRGSGTTLIDGKPSHWEQGDTFIAPLWSWHEHANGSNTEEAILFSMHDSPISQSVWAV